MLKEHTLFALAYPKRQSGRHADSSTTSTTTSVVVIPFPFRQGEENARIATGGIEFFRTNEYLCEIAFGPLLSCTRFLLVARRDGAEYDVWP